MFGEMFAGVPVEFTNSVVAHATFHRCRTENYPFTDTHLFVFVSHGVAGARMDDPVETDALQPIELGHMVFGEGGPRCRCGHIGCVEAHTSLPALAELLGVPEPELLQLGNDWVTAIPISSRVRPGVAASPLSPRARDRQHAERQALSRRRDLRLALAPCGGRSESAGRRRRRLPARRPRACAGVAGLRATVERQ